MNYPHNKFPLVSILLVVRNEIGHLERCLDSLRQQDYPRQRLEFVFVDGCSTDGTLFFLERQVAELTKQGFSARLFNNPKLILATGWNIGIKEARGQFVCRIDGHSAVVDNYISSGIKFFIESDKPRIAAVGGWWEHAATTPTGDLIAQLSSSKFAVGDSPFRRKPAMVYETDTAEYAIYRRSIFCEVGFFDETLGRNQDIVMHHQLKKAGYVFYTHPEMKISYYVRSSIGRLFRKAFGDGQWVALAGGEYFYLRHKIPFLFFLYLMLLCPVLAACESWLSVSWRGSFMVAALVPLFSYCFLALFSALRMKGPLFRRLLFPALFFGFHASYGVGTFWGYCRLFSQKR